MHRLNRSPVPVAIATRSLLALALLLAGLPDAAAQRPRAYESLPWVRTGGPPGGMGYDIRYNYGDYNLWYVTDAYTGLHVSTDRGHSWTASNAGITARKLVDAIPIFCVTADHHNPNIIWVGSEQTGQLFRSSDRGATWQSRSNGVDQQLLPLTFRGITIHPHSSDTLYAMGEIASVAWAQDHSHHIGIELDMTQGIVYKSTDAGAHWVQIWRGDNLARYCWIDPRQPQVMLVSTGIFDREAANTDTAQGFAGGVGILKTTDGGTTWRALNESNGLEDLFLGSLFMNPANPDLLLAAGGQNNWSFYHGRTNAGIFRSTDAGETWSRVLSGEIFTVVEYSVSHPNIAYAASSRAFYRSEDSGATWQRFSRPNNTWGPPGVIAGFPIDLQCDPENPRRVFVNNYLGGNYVTVDGGETWEDASKGYTGEFVRDIAIAPGQPAFAYVGCRTGVFRTESAGDHWIGLANPPQEMSAKFNEIVATIIHPGEPSYVLAVSGENGHVLMSRNRGESWEMTQHEGEISKIQFAPSNPARLYGFNTPEVALASLAAGNPFDRSPNFGFYASDDTGKSWAQREGDHVKKGMLISSMAVHPANDQTVYIFSPDSGMLRTTDGGVHWTHMGRVDSPLTAISIAIDPADPDRMLSGWALSEGTPGGNGIFRSTDAGVQWIQSSEGLRPEAKVSSIVYDPTDTRVVYAADFGGGVYYSTDGGVAWKDLSTGLDHVSARVLALSDDGSVLYAGVFGDGVYRLGTPPAVHVFEGKWSKGLPHTFALQQNFPNPFNPHTTIRYAVPAMFEVELAVYDVLGRKLDVLVNERRAAGTHEVTFDASRFAGGVYFYRFAAGTFVQTRKMVCIK